MRLLFRNIWIYEGTCIIYFTVISSPLHFSILLPDTSEENALILEKRVRETLEKHDFGAIPELNFKFATAHLHYKETPDAFIGRIETLLK